MKHILGSIGLLILGASIVLGIGSLWNKINPPSESAQSGNQYQLDRIKAYIDPWADPQHTSYNLIQSLTAMGHGGVTGTGFGQGIQKLHYS